MLRSGAPAFTTTTLETQLGNLKKVLKEDNKSEAADAQLPDFRVREEERAVREQRALGAGRGRGGAGAKEAEEVEAYAHVRDVLYGWVMCAKLGTCRDVRGDAPAARWDAPAARPEVLSRRPEPVNFLN